MDPSDTLCLPGGARDKLGWASFSHVCSGLWCSILLARTAKVLASGICCYSGVGYRLGVRAREEHSPPHAAICHDYMQGLGTPVWHPKCPSKQVPDRAPGKECQSGNPGVLGGHYPSTCQQDPHYLTDRWSDAPARDQWARGRRPRPLGRGTARPEAQGTRRQHWGQ